MECFCFVVRAGNKAFACKDSQLLCPEKSLICCPIWKSQLQLSGLPSFHEGKNGCLGLPHQPCPLRYFIHSSQQIAFVGDFTAVHMEVWGTCVCLFMAVLILFSMYFIFFSARNPSCAIVHFWDAFSLEVEVHVLSWDRHLSWGLDQGPESRQKSSDSLN